MPYSSCGPLEQSSELGRLFMVIFQAFWAWRESNVTGTEAGRKAGPPIPHALFPSQASFPSQKYGQLSKPGASYPVLERAFCLHSCLSTMKTTHQGKAGKDENKVFLKRSLFLLGLPHYFSAASGEEATQPQATGPISIYGSFCIWKIYGAGRC